MPTRQTLLVVDSPEGRVQVRMDAEGDQTRRSA
jgi:hypothetical protein